MTFADVLGQPHAIETIKVGLARGRLHHALLFHGPDGVGKERTALALAQALVCMSAPGVGCGVCGACTHATTFADAAPRTPLHPDVVIVERGLYPAATLGRSTDEKTDISVDQIRRVVLERVPFPPHQAPARLVIVRRAEEMSTGAANALLKTLEEPPLHTRFVLLTTTPGELLSTIRSRTQPIRFAPLADDLVARILVARGVPADRAASIGILAGGSASAAIALSDEAVGEARTKAVEALRRASVGPLLDRLDVAASYASSTEDRARLRVDLDAMVALDAAELRAAMLAGRAVDASTIDAALDRHAMATTLGPQIDRNVNVPLALEAALLKLRRRAG
jgi:DNA polymerase-3 subunit delta'